MKNKRSKNKAIFASMKSVIAAMLLFGLPLNGIFGQIGAAQAAGAPQILNHQGRLLDSSGNLLGGTGTNYCFRFSIYSDATVGAPDTRLWPAATPSAMTVNVKNGVFNVGIGDTAAGGDALDFDFGSVSGAYLNIEVANQVGGSCAAANFETLSPRQRIVSSAYALSAASLNGPATTTSIFNSGNTTTTGSTYLGTSVGLNNIYINNWSDLAAYLPTVTGWASSSDNVNWQTNWGSKTTDDLAEGTKKFYNDSFVGSYLNGLSKAFFWSTTSADSWVSGKNYLTSYTESDPLWTAASSSYLTIATASSNYLTQASATASYLRLSNNLSDLTNTTTARNNLGLAIGTNVQAYNANLTTFAGIAPSANIQTLLGSSDYATARTNLGLGTIATQNSNNVSITGGSIASSTISGLTVANFASQNISQWTNNSGYLTSYTESDPIWTAASTTYLKVATAASTYLPISASTSLAYVKTETDPIWTAASTTYLKVTDASSLYLTQSNAIATYLPISASTSLAYVKTEADPLSIHLGTTSVSSITTLSNLSITKAQISDFGSPLYSYTESDPFWMAASSSYLTVASASSNYLSLASWNATSTKFLTTTTAAASYISKGSCGINEVLKWDGANWICATDLTAGGGGGGSFWMTSTNGLVGSPTLGPGHAIVVGNSVYPAATSSDVSFEVIGHAKLGGNVLISGNTTTTGSVTIGSLLGIGGQTFSNLAGVGLINNGGTLSVATSSLNLTTTDIAEGSRPYYSDARVASYLDSSSTIHIANWNSAYSIINASSSFWNTAYNTVTAGAANWNTAYAAINNSSTNWNTAYSWGNHADAGYLLSSIAANTYLPLSASTSLAYLKVETDPVWTAASTTYLKVATAASTYLPISASTSLAYVKTESDPIWTAASTTYLKVTDASSLYLTQSNASATYLPISASTSLAYVKTEVDPLSIHLGTTSVSSITTLSNLSITKSQISDFGSPLYSYTESDPFWMAASSSYLTAVSAASTYLPISASTSLAYVKTEVDPLSIHLGTTSVSSITTLSNLSITKSQISDFGSPLYSYTESDPFWMAASSSYLTVAGAASSYLPISASTSLAYVKTESDPLSIHLGTTSVSSITTLSNLSITKAQISDFGSPLYSYTESDPLWTAASSSYLTIATASSNYLTQASATASYLRLSNNLSDLTNAATARNNLGLAIGTNVQAYSANLTTFAGIAPSANIQTLLGSSDYATARTNLGLGTIATQNSNNVSITGGSIASSTISGLTVANFASQNISQWTNNSGYLTSFTESDPIWTAASTTYLKVATAASTYLPISASTSLAYVKTETDPIWTAASTTYLKVTDASSLYLTQSNAIATYLPISASTSLAYLKTEADPLSIHLGTTSVSSITTLSNLSITKAQISDFGSPLYSYTESDPFWMTASSSLLRLQGGTMSGALTINSTLNVSGTSTFAYGSWLGSSLGTKSLQFNEMHVPQFDANINFINSTNDMTGLAVNDTMLVYGQNGTAPALILSEDSSSSAAIIGFASDQGTDDLAISMTDGNIDNFLINSASTTFAGNVGIRTSASTTAALSVNGLSALSSTTITELNIGDVSPFYSTTIGSAIAPQMKMFVSGLAGFGNTINSENWSSIGQGAILSLGGITGSFTLAATSTRPDLFNMFYGNNWIGTYSGDLSGATQFQAISNNYGTLVSPGTIMDVPFGLSSFSSDMENDGTVNGDMINFLVNNVVSGDTHILNGNFYGLKITGANDMGGTNNYSLYADGGLNYFAGNVGIGVEVPVHQIELSGGAYSDGGSWENASDRNLKENFTALDPLEILNKINQLPIMQWNYKSQTATTTHIGPVAQDFYALFGTGGSDKAISTIDPAGIALLGIQALSLRLSVLEAGTSTTAELPKLIVSPSPTADTLTVSGAATFYGTITVIGDANFQSKVTFAEHVYYDADAAGVLKLASNSTSTKVTFGKPYDIDPIITLTPRANISGHSIWIENQSAAGFTVAIDPPLDRDIEINWQAIAAKHSSGSAETPSPAINSPVGSGENATVTTGTDDGFAFASSTPSVTTTTEAGVQSPAPNNSNPAETEAAAPAAPAAESTTTSSEAAGNQ